MNKQMKTFELLQKLNDIPMECSDVEGADSYQEESEFEDNEIGSSGIYKNLNLRMINIFR